MAGWHKPRRREIRHNREQCRSGHVYKEVLYAAQKDIIHHGRSSHAVAI